MNSHLPVFHNPDTLFDPTPFGFCHTVSAPDNGRLIFISGQSGGEGAEHHLSDDFAHQVNVALSNLASALNAHGLNFGDVLKINVFIVDHDAKKLSVWSEAVQQAWPQNQLPASTLIPVPRLALDGMKVEVDATAFQPNSYHCAHPADEENS